MFNGTEGYAPGSEWPVGGELFLCCGLAKVGGMTFGVDYQSPNLFVSSITFPTKGTNFRPLVEVDFSALAVNLDTGQTFDVSGGAEGYINFYFYNGLWYTGSRFVRGSGAWHIGADGHGSPRIVRARLERLENTGPPEV